MRHVSPQNETVEGENETVYTKAFQMFRYRFALNQTTHL